MNLSRFSFKNGFRFVAVSLALLACTACGGSGSDSTSSSVSSEVEVAGNADKGEVATADSGENKVDEGQKEVATAEGENASAAVGEAPSEGTEGVSGETPETKKAEVKVATPKRKLVARRDPFVDISVAPVVVAPSDKVRLANLSAAERASYQQKMANVKPVKPKVVVKVVKPNISVNGIVRGDAGYEAIISDGSQTRLVHVGEQIDKYKILDINPESKTVTLGLGKEHKFVYNLEKEVFRTSKDS
ncbi:hypothetical protein IJT10_08435 [bacterium]|nr:hypothetical protein [bacterium]